MLAFFIDQHTAQVFLDIHLVLGKRVLLDYVPLHFGFLTTHEGALDTNRNSAIIFP